MKRVLSGIKPTGDPTLGNYIGAMKRWGEMAQDSTKEHFFFVPNLHALTSRPHPDDLRHHSRAAVAWLIAAGVDSGQHNQAHIFMQSQLPEHSQLTWILNNYATVGELNRMTQFKDKSQKLGAEGQLVGLYDYPVMMAADILLYDVEEVPVGEDQKQHVELTRDIASRFNNIHGETFVVPKPTVQTEGARIMDLQDPTKKMSKSDDDLGGCILLVDDETTIAKKIKRAVTDSGSQVAAADDKPALSNLLAIYSILAEKPISELEEQYAGLGYGVFKQDLADLVIQKLRPLQSRYHELMSPGNNTIDSMTELGRSRASHLASIKMKQVYDTLGLF